ncbi:MAG TPA: quinol:electron acceptor oxidoreductase subunit ActD, partial [Fimbriimonadaceae bacterium]|nr:quinol:electron acceptor oxidoreductase subunit ActD [Fimbriimonadaceae bacterium]
GLPRYHHPIFSAENFDRATQDRFFLCIEAKDPNYEAKAVETLLKSQDPLNVSTVEEPEFE